MLNLAAVALQADGEEFAMDPMILLAVFAVLVIVAIGVTYWVYKDASKRNNNELLWAIGTGFLLFLFPLFGIVALVAYLIVRGDETSPDGVQDESGAEW